MSLATNVTVNTRHKYLSGLYAITSAIQNDPDKIIDCTEQALRGGARIIQFRDKQNSQEQRQDICRTLRHLTYQANALFIVNDDVALAKHSNADGVHLGQDDTSLMEARKQLGRNSLIGVSCYNRFDLAEQAVKEGADYIAFGRFYPSTTKPDAVKAEIHLLNRAKQELDIPVVAIGGITPDNGKKLIEAGADMLAVVDGIYGQDDIKTAAQKYCTLFTS